jgi:hypothetical protein
VKKCVWRLSISNNGRVDVTSGTDAPRVGDCTSLKT